jgi:hypothetical protein
MTAARFLGIDLSLRPDLTIFSIEGAGQDRRQLILKPASCGKSQLATACAVAGFPVLRL